MAMTCARNANILRRPTEVYFESAKSAKSAKSARAAHSTPNTTRLFAEPMTDGTMPSRETLRIVPMDVPCVDPSSQICGISDWISPDLERAIGSQ